jgi:hypothetical protein
MPISLSKNKFEIVFSEIGCPSPVSIFIRNKIVSTRKYLFVFEHYPKEVQPVGPELRADIAFNEEHEIIFFFTPLPGSINDTQDCITQSVSGTLIHGTPQPDYPKYAYLDAVDVVEFSVVIPPGASMCYEIRYIYC